MKWVAAGKTLHSPVLFPEYLLPNSCNFSVLWTIIRPIRADSVSQWRRQRLESGHRLGHVSFMKHRKGKNTKSHDVQNYITKVPRISLC